MTHERHQIAGLRIALEMERRGRSLYLRAQKLTEDPELLQLLRQLASEEAVHHAQFSAMLDIFGLPPMTEEENALAAAKVADFYFPGGLMQVALDGALSSYSAMLEEAIQAESDSIGFYEKLLAQMTSARQKEVIRSIIEEEEKHLKTLRDRKEKL